MTDTILVLSGIGEPPYVLRGITETVEPQDRGQLRQTVNGDLVDLSDADRDRRFAVRLTGGDMWPFPFGGVWRGLQVTVSCVQTIARRGNVTAGVVTVDMDREPVTGSGLALHDTKISTTSVSFSQSSAGLWSATANFSAGGLGGAATVYYRPKLVCLVDRWSQDYDEWGARPGWSLELLEKNVP